MKTIGTIFLLLALPLLAPAQTNVPTGKVVWWGRDMIQRSHYSNHTNGIVESDDEILSNVVAIAGNTWQGLLLKNDGTVLGIGNNFWGGNDIPADLSNVVSIAIRGHSCLATKRDGTVTKWGNKYGEQDNESIVSNLSNVVSLANGGGHVLALKTDGTVIAWGNNAYDAATVPRGISNVVAIAATENENLVLKRDGTVIAWGNNYFGQTSVPAGLSNVVAIASAGDFSMAITIGNIPSSVFITPHGRLEEIEREADLVFKGQVLSTTETTNSAFRVSSLKVKATRFKIISVLKGDSPTNEISFEHYSGYGARGFAWSGPSPPAFLKFETGKSYLVFAARMDKPSSYYSPAADITNVPGRFRQIADVPKTSDEGAIRTLDAHPIKNFTVKEAHWFELNLLLNDSNPTNQLYAIDKLEGMFLRGGQYEEWRRSDDFKRQRVLTALLPLVTNQNEQVATRAISCFAASSNAVVQLEPFADALIKVANNSTSAARRLTAIDALSGIDCDAVSNSLAQLLQNADENIRVGATGLLPRFQKEFAESALQEHSTDASPKVRAAVADAIGNGKIIVLLPTLEKLWNDTNNVHTSAGNALLKFDIDQVSNILTAHLNDEGFRESYLCKLAEKNTAPWLTNLVAVLKVRRERNWEQAQTSGIKETTNYFHALMSLSGTDFNCWNIIHDYLVNLPDSAFAGGKLDWCLDVLEDAGNTGSREPVMLYELYKSKGLNERAAIFRRNNGNCYGFDVTIYFDRVDAERSKQ